MPNNFKPYIGLYLDDYPGHIHYNVDGYKNLAWAIPLDVDQFSVKNIKSNEDITNAFQQFCKTINVQTDIKIETQRELF